MKLSDKEIQSIPLLASGKTGRAVASPPPRANSGISANDMGRDRKYGEPSMSLSEFNGLVVPCSDAEIDRLRDRYRLYYRPHRQLFTDLLRGEFQDESEFKAALLAARIRASAAGKTSNKPVVKLKRTSPASFARTNERKFIKLATRILFLRLTSGAGRSMGRDYKPWPLPCDLNPPQEPADAKHELVKIMKRWAVGYDAIRKTHTPFQDEL
jgi:hypothetical protein